MDITKLSKLRGRDKLEYAADYMNKCRPSDYGPCEIMSYNRQGTTYHNLYAVIPTTNLFNDTVAITAHHDVVNERSDNCLDNTASVYNLIHIHNQLLQGTVNRDIIIGITDAEETCDRTKFGVGELLMSYDPDYLIDLELTASGDVPISTQYGRFGLFQYESVTQPLNNAKMAWQVAPKLGLKLRGASCVALMSEDDLSEYQTKKYCNRWMQCHGMGDTFDKWLNLEDMQKFRNTICSHFLEVPAGV
jgi:hypothetical protein